MSELLKEAIAGLGINVPIYRTEEQAGVLILYLYGGAVLRWPTSRMATPDAGTPAGSGTTEPLAQAVADFSVMPYVGEATTKALHDAGYLTFPDLIAATDTALLDVPKLNTYTLTKIRDYLSRHFT